ncbi:MAG: hypothetical protein LBH01_11970 [Verrucomicrobiales bacterium]|jgi:hypothetical protein|nr:hypothetical protein [Verrucomicrobiales bacterium]
MKTTHLKITALSLVLGLGATLGTASVKADFSDLTGRNNQAQWVNTTKGPRLTVTQEKSLRTVEDFQSLNKGDKIAVYCPLMKETFVTTIRDVDSKGHAKIKQTSKGYEVEGCNIILQRKDSSRETDTVMVCPDGKVRPVECSKM